MRESSAPRGRVVRSPNLVYNRSLVLSASDRRNLVPFTNLLERLVSNIQGADGALVLESDGEAVQWYCPGGAELLRLRCAYLGDC